MPASVRRTIAAACLLIAAAAFAPVTADAQTPTSSTSVPEPASSVDVVGDSLTVQAFEYLGGWVDAPSSDTERIAEAGWSMVQAQGPYSASVAAHPPDVTVLALGNNDSDPASGGWDLFDIVRWHDFLHQEVPAGSCVVLVLPRFGPAAPLAWAREVNEARGYLVDLVAPGGQFQPPPEMVFVLEDWYLPPAAVPNRLAPDGIHLSGNEAAVTRQDLMWDGVNSCPQGGI